MMILTPEPDVTRNVECARYWIFAEGGGDGGVGGAGDNPAQPAREAAGRISRDNNMMTFQ
jgi:hypothetical protein